MEYDKELKLDDMLAAGITSDEELLKWLNSAEYHHLNPITIDTGRYGCSSFAAKTPDGEIIFGRNFDYPETDTVMIYMDPEQARDLLAAVVQSSITEWSAVYNLNDFTADVYVDQHYDYAYRYGY